MIDKVKNFKQFVNENVENLTTLYHGTSNDKDAIERDYMFLSTSPTFAKEYGDKILHVKVNVGRVFNTLLLSDIQLLYKNGFKLYDPNVDEDWDDIGYNFNKDEFRTAKAFVNSPTNDNTWDAIESTEGVVEWIFNNGFDSILITEDGVENYICKNMNKDNLKHEKQRTIHDISSSTVIEPINCELSEGMKVHIVMIEWSNKLFDETRRQLMIPKEMFGSK